MPFYRLPPAAGPTISTPKAYNVKQIQDLFSQPFYVTQPNSRGLLHLLDRLPHFTGSSEAPFSPLAHGEDAASLQNLEMLLIHPIHDQDLPGSTGL